MTDTTKERAQFEAKFKDTGLFGAGNEELKDMAFAGWMARAEQSTETPPRLIAKIQKAQQLADDLFDVLTCKEIIELCEVAEAPRPVGTPERGKKP